MENIEEFFKKMRDFEISPFEILQKIELLTENNLDKLELLRNEFNFYLLGVKKEKELEKASKKENSPNNKTTEEIKYEAFLNDENSEFGEVFLEFINDKIEKINNDNYQQTILRQQIELIRENSNKSITEYKNQISLQVNNDERIKLCKYIEIELRQLISNFEINSLEENPINETIKKAQKAELDWCLAELEKLNGLKIQNAPKNDRTTKLSVKQIALIHVYEEIHITRINANEIANKYGYTSGEGLYQDFSFFSSTANRKGKPTPNTPKKLQNKIELFESILPKLTSNKAKERAKNEINTLKTLAENENQETL